MGGHLHEAQDSKAESLSGRNPRALDVKWEGIVLDCIFVVHCYAGVAYCRVHLGIGLAGAFG